MDERVRFIAPVQEDPLGNFTRLCERFGISRDKGYKWVARYKEHGPSGLVDLPPRGRSCPHKTSDAVAEALGMRMPTSHYEPSPRVMPDRPREPEYGDDMLLRQVNSNGYFSLLGERLFAGTALEGRRIGLHQTDEEEWEIFYGPLLIGYVLVRDGTPRVEPVR